METNWTSEELHACVATYLWMLRAEQDGLRPVKARVNAALRQGPLHARSQGSLEYRFQNISSVLQEQDEEWIAGYKPAKNVGSSTSQQIQELIKDCRANKSRQRLNWLVMALPAEVIQDAATQLAAGAAFDYADSTTYDVAADGKLLPPKKVIAFACQNFFGARLYPQNFSAGDSHAAFRKLNEAGLTPQPKSFTDPNAEHFRSEVVKRLRVKQEPKGNPRPRTQTQTTTVFVRDPAVVAFVEQRAQGRCELCGAPAPFKRADGTPYLEVHHVKPLSEEGPDTPDNAVALCPNCHRACHHSAQAQHLQTVLMTRFGVAGGAKSQHMNVAAP